MPDNVVPEDELEQDCQHQPEGAHQKQITVTVIDLQEPEKQVCPGDDKSNTDNCADYMRWVFPDQGRV